MSHPIPDHRGYPAGHPWFFLLGGPIPKPRAIRAAANARNYAGYRIADIETADRRGEPERSRTLRALEADILNDLRRDLSQYRKLARELRSWREEGNDREPGPACADIHVAISLKFAHVYNGLANLCSVKARAGRQLDLFAL